MTSPSNSSIPAIFKSTPPIPSVSSLNEIFGRYAYLVLETPKIRDLSLRPHAVQIKDSQRSDIPILCATTCSVSVGDGRTEIHTNFTNFNGNLFIIAKEIDSGGRIMVTSENNLIGILEELPGWSIMAKDATENPIFSVTSGPGNYNIWCTCTRVKGFSIMSVDNTEIGVMTRESKSYNNSLDILTLTIPRDMKVETKAVLIVAAHTMLIGFNSARKRCLKKFGWSMFLGFSLLTIVFLAIFLPIMIIYGQKKSK